MGNEHDLLTACELAAKLKRSVGYIYAMKRNGFVMPGGLASISQALAWLARNPPPRSERGRKRKISA